MGIDEYLTRKLIMLFDKALIVGEFVIVKPFEILCIRIQKVWKIKN